MELHDNYVTFFALARICNTEPSDGGVQLAIIAGTFFGLVRIFRQREDSWHSAIMEKSRKFLRRVRNHLASLDDEKDFFRPMQCFLVIGGIHLLSRDPLHRRLFFCYRILLAIQFFVWADRVYVALVEWNFHSDLIGVCTFFVAVVMILLRAGLIRFYLNDLEDICAFLGRRLNANRSGRRDQSYRLMRRIALGLEVTFLVDQLLLYVFGVHRNRLYSTPENIARLDWWVKTFFDVANGSNHFVYSSLYVTILTVLNALLMALEAELNDVVAAFAGTFQRVDRTLDGKMGKGVQAAGGASLFWMVLEQELNSIVIRHSELLDQLAKLDEFFKMTFLLMFYMEIVVLGCAAFYINVQGLTVNTFIVASYSVANLLECYWFCRLVDNLNDANGQIGSVLYNLNWHQRLRKTPRSADAYLKIRASFLTVMAISQRNLGISCGGLFEMSAGAFQQLTNMIYNFLMFLINTSAIANRDSDEPRA